MAHVTGVLEDSLQKRIREVLFSSRIRIPIKVKRIRNTDGNERKRYLDFMQIDIFHQTYLEVSL